MQPHPCKDNVRTHGHTMDFLFLLLIGNLFKDVSVVMEKSQMNALAKNIIY